MSYAYLQIMGRPPKRTRTTVSGAAASSRITIKEVIESKEGYSWSTFLVQGWKESGRWKRRRFKKRSDAEAFAALKRVEIQNSENRLFNVVTSLTNDQIKDAEAAIRQLSNRYTLSEAVEFFLTRHCDPDLKVSWKDGVSDYLQSRLDEGCRENSIAQTASVLRMAQRFFEDPFLHEVDSAMVKRFLESLRAKNRRSKATPKTWNNYRAELHAFFRWAVEDKQWVRENPVAAVKRKTAAQRGLPEIKTASEVADILKQASQWQDGVLAKYYALAFFAGIRPEGEMMKLSKDEGRYIDLKRGVIHIQPEVSKTGQYRQIPIRPNLAKWLKAYPGPILPKNHDRLLKGFRQQCQLGHDIARHTFISHHVAAFKSVGEASLEAGNSEFIVRKHYLNLLTETEGADYWEITPDEIS